MVNVVINNGQLARLWKKGILFVRMIWMMSVWVMMRLNEPAGLKERSAGWIPALEQIEHDEEGRVVEDRADGSDAENEPPDLSDLPGPRPRDQLVVHCIVGDWDLREVVEHVVGQNLNRSHGKEWQKGTCPQDAEHVSEVGTGSHADVLDDVGEDFSSLDDTPFQHHQVLLQQNQIGRFLGDVGRGIDRDANVRGAQCRGSR